ncbi:MAG: hypothetical protein IPI64_11095 [Chloracidobacterium sp.]|nr:hypothetical protein [Chloracidobacterium sp.]
MAKTKRRTQPERADEGIEDSRLHEIFTAEYESVLHSVYSKYFRQEGKLVSDQMELKVKETMEGGFHFAVETAHGNIQIRLDTVQLIATSYFNLLLHRLGGDSVEPRDLVEEVSNASDDHKLVIEDACAQFLVNYLRKINEEIPFLLKDAASLAIGEMETQLFASKEMIEESIKTISNETGKRRRKESGLGPGGWRPRKGFTWSKDSKVAFYEMVTKTPMKNGKTIWEHACKFLIEEGYESDTVQWLLSRPGFENVDRDLFNEAVKGWKKYDERSEITEDEDKPRFFEYRQALITLGVPDEYKFGTLDNYFRQGRKGSNFQM